VYYDCRFIGQLLLLRSQNMWVQAPVSEVYLIVFLYFGRVVKLNLKVTSIVFKN